MATVERISYTRPASDEDEPSEYSYAGSALEAPRSAKAPSRSMLSVVLALGTNECLIRTFLPDKFTRRCRNGRSYYYLRK